MMERLLARAEEIAQAAQAKRIEAIANTAKQELSGLSIRRTATGVVIQGKQLLERWLLDPALRFLGSFSQ